jgi:hypothetical protein
MSKYFTNLVENKTRVQLRLDMGYTIMGHILDVSVLGIVFHIEKSNHQDYEIGKNTFISASADCSFTEI